MTSVRLGAVVLVVVRKRSVVDIGWPGIASVPINRYWHTISYAEAGGGGGRCAPLSKGVACPTGPWQLGGTGTNIMVHRKIAIIIAKPFK